MKVPTLEARTSAQAADTDLVVVFQDTRKKALAPQGGYSGTVEKLTKAKAFDGSHGSMQFLRFGGRKPAENLLVVGLGSAAELTEEKARIAGAKAWSRLIAEKVSSLNVHVDPVVQTRGFSSQTDSIRIVRAFVEGMALSGYKWEKYKSKKATPAKDEVTLDKVSLLIKDKASANLLNSEMKSVQAAAECVNVTRDWSNEPSNEGTPEYYAAQAQKFARANGLKCRVLREADAKRERMGLFLGVGQGSDREGRVVIVEYTPAASKNAKNIILVGKGITFDSGGISIKPSMKMENMKHDMTGAATIMGAVLLAAKWKIKNKVTAIMGFTENMPSGCAIQPGNVLTSRSGKTVEVINTDAEGRLILADLLDLAQDRKPDALINVATLTGAVMVALGKQCCGVMGNDEELIGRVKTAGEVHSERIWQLPLWDEYFEDMKSATADMKNSANDPYGGSIRAGIFLKQFIREKTRWAHLDIAATGDGMGHIPYYPKQGASGMHVRTLAQFAADFS